MKMNAFGLVLLAGCGSNLSQGDTGGFCLKHRLQQEIPGYSAQQDFRNRLPFTNRPLCSRPATPASAPAGQTDSPEPIRFGYFPL
jgi:hypothetical protein